MSTTWAPSIHVVVSQRRQPIPTHICCWHNVRCYERGSCAYVPLLFLVVCLLICRSFLFVYVQQPLWVASPRLCPVLGPLSSCSFVPFVIFDFCRDSLLDCLLSLWLLLLALHGYQVASLSLSLTLLHPLLLLLRSPPLLLLLLLLLLLPSGLVVATSTV